MIKTANETRPKVDLRIKTADDRLVVYVVADGVEYEVGGLTRVAPQPLEFNGQLIMADFTAMVSYG